MTEQKDKRCGTCRHCVETKGKDGLPKTYCRLNGHKRDKDDMQDCLGWKERK
jgi:hypothetical protein